MKEKLYRSTKQKMVAGVASGLGDYLNVDPVIIRIIFVLLTVFNGVGVLVYIIMWIIVPADDNSRPDFVFNSAKTGSNAKDDKEHVIIEDANAQETNTSNNQEYKTDGGEKVNIQEKSDKPSVGRLIFGGLLIFFGLAFFIDNFVSWFDFHDFIPLLLIMIGLTLLWNSIRK